MEISTRYNPLEVEEKWYSHWEEQGYFHSTPDDREPFVIVIPPPNVTGVLHMGHMLNNTVQDILIRKARLDGKNACWVPGTDHASIATEAKVVSMLREEGIKKSDLSRDEFLEHAWKWTDKYGGIILKQLRKLGASCDWDRTAFTMDETRSKSVFKVFVDLYKKGKLYRKLRMVNWDPQAKTVLSNEEVIYQEESGKLHFVRYKVSDTDDEWITIATTRPETILGDTGIAVAPDDERYAKYKGKTAIVPLINREIPIIFDSYVDKEFGTGALKVTPAHDVNDYDIGQRHNLETIDIFNDDGSISEAGQLYIGTDRFDARKSILKDLDEQGHLIKLEDYTHNVGRSERTGAIVEPKLSLQWYVDMKALAGPALEAVETDEVSFYPKNQKNLYRHWMENIRDWCVSRQLWWGHRIPAWYLDDEVFVAETADEALKLAVEKTGRGDLTIQDLRQDEDVLDTWFSSWLWPISVFDGFENREELDYYYPTSVLVTGWDIIFLWVARMIMAGYEWEEKRPYNHVYFTGMVRDKKRRKMSKSLGNSPDALKLIEDFGADGVRFGMMSCSPAGGDLLFDEKLCEQGRNFCNKVWNALRLIKGWEIADVEAPKTNLLAISWMKSRIAQVREDMEAQYKSYRLSEALMNVYGLIWNDFCSWYLEMIKPPYEHPIDKGTYQETLDIFAELCNVLHPFMPFISEEVWHHLDRKKGTDCMMTIIDSPHRMDPVLNKDLDILKELVSKVRDIRNKHGVKMVEELDFRIITSDTAKNFLSRDGLSDLLAKMAKLKSVELVDSKEKGAISFVIGTDEYFVNLNIEIDTEAELDKAQEELNYQKGFLISVEKKLSNSGFVNNAPEAVVENERKKLSDAKARIVLLEKKIEDLKS